MRVSIYQNIFRSAVLMQNAQYSVHRTALLAARIQFSIAISPGTALAKTVIAIGVNYTFSRNFCDVHTTVHHIFPAFYHDGFDA